MSFLAGTLALDARWPGRSVAERMAKANARYHTLQPRLLYGDDFVTLYVVERARDHPTIRSCSRTSSEEMWFLGDLNYARPDVATAVPAFLDWSRPSSLESILGRWLAVHVRRGAAVVRFATDRLGLAWLYIARTSGGFVFCSDFAAVAAHLGTAPTIECDTVLLELAMGYAPDESTVFSEINIAPAGSVFELGAGGMQMLSRKPIQYGDRYVHLRMDEKFEILDDIYDRITRSYIESFESDIVLSISAGYDSRIALACFEKHGYSPELFTYGYHPQCEEVRGAEAVCARINRTTNIFRVTEFSWDDWCKRVFLLGNSAMLLWDGWGEDWFTLLRTQGRVAVIGFMGDALSGKPLQKVSDALSETTAWKLKHDTGDWLDGWIRMHTARWGLIGSPLLRKAAQQRLRAILYERTRAASEKAEYAFSYQKYLHCSLYGRERRHDASQLNMASRFITPIAFFYTNEFVDFWTNLSFDDLVKQNLYLSYAQSRFPQLFPSAKSRDDPLTRLMCRGVRFAGRLATGRISDSRPPTFDHELPIVQNREKILALARKVQPAMDDIIDVDLFCKRVGEQAHKESIHPSLIIPVVNLFMLISLAT